MKSYYFDHAASAPVHPTVARTLAELIGLHYANASSLHRAGAEAQKLADRARSVVAEAIGAATDTIVFTSGGTESNNLAIKGYLGRLARSGKHIVTTATEHASVYECARQLERSGGVRVTYVPVDCNGAVDPQAVADAVEDDTAIVSIMHVNNETGAVQPVQAIGERLRGRPGVKFHVDGVQAIGKLPVRPAEWGIDMYSGSGHKFGGPKGVGFLYVREGIELEPLMAGGGQEHGHRSGTLNVPGIVATAQAVRLAEESREKRREAMFRLRDRLADIVADIPELVWNGYPAGERERTAPHIANVSYPGMRPEVLVHMLEKHGIYISTQSACSSRSLKPSRVLLAMGCDAGRASGSIRISFGDEHGEAELETLGERLRMAVAKLKPLEGGGRG